jgi:hypothetical protein
MAFCLVAFNGRPFVLSSGFYCLLLCFALLAVNGVSASTFVGAGFGSVLIAGLWSLWILVACASALVNFEVSVGSALLWGYLVPFLVFLSVVGAGIDARGRIYVVVALATGLILRLGAGAVQFFREWGLPNAAEILVARYDLQRMAGYMDSTFGNTGNTASIAAVLFPVFLVTTVWLRLGSVFKAVSAVGLVTVIVTLAITGSRSAIMFSFFSALFVMIRLASPLMSVAFLGLFSVTGATALFTLSDWGSLGVLETLLTVDLDSDASLSERADSVVIGLQTMADNPLGVGPGLSAEFNQYTVPHQFIVAQGSEIGALGAAFPALIFVVLVLRAIKAPTDSRCVGSIVSFAFSCGALIWSLYAMVTNIAVNSGPTIPWIGMLALCAALGARGRSRVAGCASMHGR